MCITPVSSHNDANLFACIENKKVLLTLYFKRPNFRRVVSPLRGGGTYVGWGWEGGIHLCLCKTYPGGGYQHWLGGTVPWHSGCTYLCDRGYLPWSGGLPSIDTVGVHSPWLQGTSNMCVDMWNQSETITFPHPTDAGGNKALTLLCFTVLTLYSYSGVVWGQSCLYGNKTLTLCLTGLDFIQLHSSRVCEVSLSVCTQSIDSP